MRICLWLAAGAMAIGTAAAAAARPGGSGSGPGNIAPGAWSSGVGHHGGRRVHGRYGPGVGKGDHGRRHGRFGRHMRGGFDLYGGGGIAGPVGAVDPYGSGFFTGGGGGIRLRGGRPHYEYDRAYPYEWASAAGERLDRREEERWDAAERPARCTFENGVRVCRGW